jgi:hypothetical protein
VATPEPSPLPVYIVDPAPSPWSAEWWIDAGIPLLGAIGSIAVAAATLAVTIALARWERRDRANEANLQRAREKREEEQFALDRRADFLAVLAELMSDWERNGVLPTRVKASVPRVMRDVHNAATRSTEDARDVGMWFIREVQVWAQRMIDGVPDLPSDSPRAGWRTFDLMVGERLRVWARTGEFDDSALMQDARMR